MHSFDNKKLNHKKRIALVLGGGCIKASAFHIGVCAALQEKGFRLAGGSKEFVNRYFPEDQKTIKTYIGSSAGAIIATFLASGFDVQTIIDAFIQGKKKKKKNFFQWSKKKDPIPLKKEGLFADRLNHQNFNLPKRTLKALTYSDLFSFNFKKLNFFSYFSGLFKKSNWAHDGGGIEYFLKKSFKINGFFNTENLEKYLRNHVCEENSFHSLGVQLYILTTQLNHPKRMIFGPFSASKIQSHTDYSPFADISKAAAASASLPPFFAPFGIQNEKKNTIYYFDGDLRTPLAIPFAEELGADLIIASYLVQPYQYTESLGSLHKQGMPVITNQALYQIFGQSILMQREERKKLKTLYQSLSNYIDQQKIQPSHKEKILNLFESETQYKKNTQTLHIHPDGKDTEMFLIDHFSLNEKILTKIVKKGYKAALLALNQFESPSL